MMSVDTTNVRLTLGNGVVVIVTDLYAILSTARTNVVVMIRANGLIAYMPDNDLNQAQQFEAANMLISAITHMQPQYQPPTTTVAAIPPAGAGAVAYGPINGPSNNSVVHNPLRQTITTILLASSFTAVVVGAVAYGPLLFSAPMSNSLAPIQRITGDNTVAISVHSDALNRLTESLNALQNGARRIEDKTDGNTVEIVKLKERVLELETKQNITEEENKLIEEGNKRIEEENRRIDGEKTSTGVEIYSKQTASAKQNPNAPAKKNGGGGGDAAQYVGNSQSVSTDAWTYVKYFIIFVMAYTFLSKCYALLD